MDVFKDMDLDQPAFPTWRSNKDMKEGMTLRDYFAAAAMQGLLSSEHFRGAYKLAVEDAYRAADEMLSQREKTDE